MRYPLAFVLCVLFAADGFSATSVIQSGITFYFSSDRTTGQFANGDYWVLGPVTIDSITPHFDGSNNGWEVNPGLAGPHGLQSGCYSNDTNFDPALVPVLPHTVNGISSILKTTPDFSSYITGKGYRPCLSTAVVLTVLDAVPADNGATVFRPPYVGTEKPLFSTDDLRTDLLPEYAPVATMTGLDWVVETFSPVLLDHGQGALGRALRPSDNMNEYSADNGTNEGVAATRLMFNDPLSEKMPALVRFVQCGIDYHYMIKLGQRWPSGGGEQPAHRMPWVFAAVMLDNEEMKTLNGEVELYNDFNTQWGNDNVAVFGQNHHSWSERGYWSSLVNPDAGNKTQADPYGYIDGGPVPGRYYQECCTSQPWKTQLMAFHMMPALKEVWWDRDLSQYTDRWVDSGIRSQPDPCAPAEATMDNYGVTFGPDGSGGCIRDTDPSDGIGRFPDLHGTKVDGGLRFSNFVTAAWQEYRYGIPIDGPVITPDGGSHDAAVVVDFGRVPYGVEYRYTDDGTDPDNSSTLYTGAMTLLVNTTIKARAYKTGYAPSDIVEAVFTVAADHTPPAVSGITTTEDPTRITVVFSELLDGAAAATAGNYSLDNGVSVSGATVAGSGNAVILAVSGLTDGVRYTLTINNVADLYDNVIAANTQEVFTYSDFDPAAGLTGFWNFNTDTDTIARDHSVLGNDGTIRNGTLVDGYLGQGLQVTGGSGEVFLGNDDFGITATQEMTIAFWVYVTGHNGDYDALIERTYVSPFSIALLPAGGIRTVIRTGSTNYRTSTDKIADNAWNHVAITYKSGESDLYLNGSLSMSDAVTGDVGFPDYRNTYVAGGLTGMIDEVRIYSRALDADKMAKLYADTTVYLVSGIRHGVRPPALPAVSGTIDFDEVMRAPAAYAVFRLDGAGVTLHAVPPAGIYVVRRRPDGAVMKTMITERP